MSDTSKHLTYFEVRNFKRFESLKMSNLGQFNLIVGDNNVGKTSVLESLLFSDDFYQMTNNLLGALQFRNLKRNYRYQDLELYINRESKPKHKEGEIFYAWAEKAEPGRAKFIEFTFDKRINQLALSSEDRHKEQSQVALHQELHFRTGLNFPYIPFYKGHDNDLTSFYSRLQQDRLVRRDFIAALKILIPTLDNIELSSPYPDAPPHLIIYQHNMRSSLPLAMFGDGLLKLFRLLAEVSINRGGRLMIDEIDTGIHFSRFKDFWRVIMQASKENDVQLFMTTHNHECIKYFKETLESELRDFQDLARTITLIETQTKEVKAFTYSFSEFEANIELGNEIRGGQL